MDAFDTDNYVQMIMPLHGQGIDLYEFIEKGAKIDESLASYIFRQVKFQISNKIFFNLCKLFNCSIQFRMI